MQLMPASLQMAQLQQILAQSGIELDMEGMWRLFTRYSGLTEFSELLRVSGQPITAEPRPIPISFPVSAKPLPSPCKAGIRFDSWILGIWELSTPTPAPITNIGSTNCPRVKFALAVKAEEVHAQLYTKALEAVKEGKDLTETEFYLCPVCGHIEFGTPPNKCPICGAPAAKFALI